MFPKQKIYGISMLLEQAIRVLKCGLVLILVLIKANEASKQQN